MTALDCIDLLKRLIAIPSPSRNETAAADLLEAHMREQDMEPTRTGNNLWEVAPGFMPQRPTLILNAHIDTVKPVADWTFDPYVPTVVNDDEGDARLYGLGSNDDGASLVTLLATYLSLRPQAARQTGTMAHAATADASAAYNLIFIASAEEEVSGANGISSVLPLIEELWTKQTNETKETNETNGGNETNETSEGSETSEAPWHDVVALVGEPTCMQPAIAEKGLMVLDCVAHGKAGHAAREEGDNAIMHALSDIQWFGSYQFAQTSGMLGPVKMTTTIIEAGTQHNVIPDRCCFTVDVRSNECYSNEEIYDIVRAHIKSEVKARSFRLNSSRIDAEHPLIRRAVALGRQPFGSPTLSDQALMPFPSFKMGPGDSRRSHTTNEYIEFKEIEEALRLYASLLHA
ncbi:MAG: M20 family metallo-hydrolase [Bacteroidales bacterium]|nr:M20 family metallo-hydrolase [Candidatus Physcousia equi]